MNATEMKNKAMELAIRGHHGQVNKHDGEPYLLHVLRVAQRADEHDSDEVATAWLHDVLEDTEITVRDLELAGMPPEVVAAVVALTKVAGRSNEDYYRIVKRNDLARRVKIHDIHDNFSRNYKVEDPATQTRLANKYSVGLDILTNTGV